MGRLTLDPPSLIQEGNHTKNIHAELVRDTNEVYATIENMLNNGFNSPGARTIASKIFQTKEDIADLLQNVRKFSDFLFFAAKTGADTDAGIADRYKINYGG